MTDLYLTEGKIHLFYHVDADGYCSAAVFLLWFWRNNIEREILLYPINYNDPFPWDKIAPTDTVIMVDFSLQPAADMDRLVSLLKEEGSFIWIDHHTTALNMEFDFETHTVLGNRRVGDAGCELSWEFCFQNEFQDEEAPTAVNLVGRYDVWDHDSQYDWETEILPFHELLSFTGMNPKVPGNKEKWLDFLRMEDGYLQPFLEKGRLIQEINSKRDRKYCTWNSHSGFLFSKEGSLRVIAINGGISNSVPMEPLVDPEKHDAIMVYTRQKSGEFKVSLYVPNSLDTDVSAIAKSFGGGGHQKAAGFHISYEDFGKVFTMKPPESGECK